jgi:hypothetical protein
VSQTSCLSIIEKKDNLGLIRYVSTLTPLDGVDSKNQLSIIKREKGEDYVLEQIIFLMKWLNDAFTKNLSDSSIFEVSLDILQDYWFFKIEDIAIFAKEFRKGNIVKIPYHLEIQHIYEGLKVYDRMRMDFIQQRHNDIKQIGLEDRQPELTQGQKIGNLVKHINENNK